MLVGDAAGLADALPFRQISRTALRDLLAEALGATAMKAAAARLRDELDALGGIRSAALRSAALATRRG